MRNLICLFFIGTVSICRASDFPTGSEVEILANFSNGLNTVSPTNKLGEGYSPNMRNVFIHRKPGKILERNGFVQVGSTNTLKNVRVLFTFYHEDGTKEFIVSDDSVVLTTKDFNTYTTIISSLNNAVHLEAAQVRNKVWLTNGSDPVFTWDGTAMQKLDGNGGLPNVPKFRHLTYYQERVFGLNVSGNASALDWSDVASTNGVAIAPDSFLAWPAANSLNIGQGDGQVGTALWVFANQLQIGKERSIYTLYGTNTSNYTPRKTESWVGPSSADSVIIMDDITYFKGADGIYAYNGGGAVRISDAISPDVAAMLDDRTQIISQSWATNSDFDKGQFNGVTDTGTPGFLTIGTEDKIINPIGGFRGTGIGNPPLNAGSTFYQLFVNFGGAISTGTKYYTTQIGNFLVSYTGSDLRLFITNQRTGEQYISTYSYQANAVIISSQNPVFDGSDVNLASYTINLEWVSGPGGTVQSPNVWIFSLAPATTGQFISNTATATSVTAWSNFDSHFQTNGGAVNFYVRSDGNPNTISTAVWQSIVPGVVLPFPTSNNYFQWAATMTSVSSATNIPNIDDVNMAFIQGSGSKDRPFGIAWNKEYWLSIATETSGLFSLQYVKSWITNPNPNAWMVMNGMNLRAFTKDGTETLYGGSASTGAVYRLDYGTNDNGNAIDAFYETKNLFLKGDQGERNIWLNKKVSEIWVDVDAQSGNILRLGRSINGGAYTEDLVDTSGSGRLPLVRYLSPSLTGKFFKLRFRNNQKDMTMGVNYGALVYENLLTR